MLSLPARDDAVLAELLAGAVEADSFGAAQAALRQFGRGISAGHQRAQSPANGPKPDLATLESLYELGEITADGDGDIRQRLLS